MNLYTKFFVLCFVSINISSEVFTTSANNGNLILEEMEYAKKEELRYTQNYQVMECQEMHTT